MNRAIMLVAAAMVLAAVGVGAGAAANNDLYQIGSDHDLATNESVQTFEKTGVASANLTTLDASLTVAKSHSKADIDGTYVDVNKVWVCVDYREEIPRTLEIDIPAEYAEPRPGETTSTTSEHHISYRPVADGNATRVRVGFDSAGRACWSMQRSSGWYFGVKDRVREIVNSTTGWSLPTLAGPTADWQRVPDRAWGGTTEVPINVSSDATIQFDNDPGDERDWISVPECNNPATQPVCHYQRTNETTGNTTMVLLSTQDDPPAVRYKDGHDGSALFGGALADISQALGEFADDIGGLIGGGDG